MTNTSPKRMGRPPSTQPLAVTARIPLEMVKKLDRLRGDTTRSEAIRQMVEHYLAKVEG